jgi:hypothetical protein
MILKDLESNEKVVEKQANIAEPNTREYSLQAKDR